MPYIEPPSGGAYIILKPDTYEAVIIDILEIENNEGMYAYNPETDPISKKMKLQFIFKVREAGIEPVTLKRRVGKSLATKGDPVLVKIIQSVDSNYKAGVGYDTDFLKFKPLRLVVSNASGSGDNAGKVFNNIDGFLPTKLATPTQAQIDSLLAAVITPPTEDIPF